METIQRAEQEIVNRAIFALIDKLAEGGWHSYRWDGLPASAQSAVSVCYQAKLVDVEGFADGTYRFRLTAAGESLKSNRQGIISAIQESWGSLQSQLDAATGPPPPASAPEPADVPHTPAASSSATVEARVFDVVSKNPDAEEWSLQRLADAAGVSKSAAGDTLVWKGIMGRRESAKSSRYGKPKDRHGRGVNRPDD